MKHRGGITAKCGKMNMLIETENLMLKVRGILEFATFF